MNDFTVVTQQHPHRTLITVTGEIDLQTGPKLAQAAFIIPLGGKPLHLDLSGVSFMDSSGLNLLVLLRRRLQAEGGRLAVTGLQPQPARLLEITETLDLFAADTAAANGSDEALIA
ncbi:STAS domain-containing protein [Streptomyces sp. NBC_01788]|uniref:STAS domain-containing protein n=1 Tax=Streptomyces sp. NBC_01788 TaxID=2975940 RepID=UPI002DD7AC98|nr:STAS domain-containing protein [Streptomyces sp. NBC_01788]WSB30871.1 STAS domain-containing protein [Streptomyces sp. NBC_01788]